MNNNLHFELVKEIIHDRSTRKLLARLSNYEIHTIRKLLDNKLMYVFETVISQFPAKLVDENTANNIVQYHNKCINSNIDFESAVKTVKKIILSVGGAKTISAETKSYVMFGVNKLLNNILNHLINLGNAI